MIGSTFNIPHHWTRDFVTCNTQCNEMSKIFGKIFLVYQLFWGIAHFVENNFVENHKDDQKISS